MTINVSKDADHIRMGLESLAHTISEASNLHRAHSMSDSSMAAASKHAATKGRWSHETINSCVIGHMLVLWPMILSSIAYFTLPYPHPSMMAFFAVACGALSLLCAWLVNENRAFALGAIILTVMSWVFTAAWAIRAAW